MKQYNNEDILILSADSGAILDNELIGKPKTYSEAVNILTKLSNHTHEFVTAVYFFRLCHSERNEVKSRNLLTPGLGMYRSLHSPSTCSVSVGMSNTSLVTFRKLSLDNIKLYLKVTEYNMFAGGYAISSAQNFITKIEGSISNVIGLPLEEVIPVLRINGLM